MQLGRARLTPEERQRRQQEGRCFYYGGVGHLIGLCPVKRNQAVSHVQVFKPVPRTLTKIKLNNVWEVDVLIDSGADESLMDWGLARRLGIESELLSKTIRAKSLNEKELFTITHVSKPVQVFIGHHHELMQFHLFKSTSHSLILGNHGSFCTIHILTGRRERSKSGDQTVPRTVLFILIKRNKLQQLICFLPTLPQTPNFQT